MSERERTEGAEGADTDPAATPSEESWRRHLDILELLKQIREAHGRRRLPDAPPRPR